MSEKLTPENIEAWKKEVNRLMVRETDYKDYSVGYLLSDEEILNTCIGNTPSEYVESEMYYERQN